MFTIVKNKLISLLQLLLVLVYILFEELIWEGIAKPLYGVIRGLKILQTLELKLQTVTPPLLLGIFVALLVMVEALGVYAGLLFVSGKVILGATLYLSKIPVAAFTFWLFRVTKEKLLSFAWFAWLYEMMLKGIVWVKTLEIYVSTMQRVETIKMVFKEWKQQFFTKENLFVMKLKDLYWVIKTSLNNR